jgi:hypothetical protein
MSRCRDTHEKLSFTVILIDFSSMSLPVKVHPEKNRNQKNSTIINRVFDSLSITVEFF